MWRPAKILWKLWLWAFECPAGYFGRGSKVARPPKWGKGRKPKRPTSLARRGHVFVVSGLCWSAVIGAVWLVFDPGLLDVARMVIAAVDRLVSTVI